MSWLKLDDGFASHPRVAALSDAAFRLHVAGMAYCAQHLTDGVIPKAVLTSLYPCSDARKIRRILGELTGVSLWIPRESAYEVQHYLHYNPSRESVEKERARWAKAKRDKRSGQTSTVESTADTGAMSTVDTPVESLTSSRPVPSNTSVTPSRKPGSTTPQPVDNDTALLVEAVIATHAERVVDQLGEPVTPGVDRKTRVRGIAAGLRRSHAGTLAALAAEHPDWTVDQLADALGDTTPTPPPAPPRSKPSPCPVCGNDRCHGTGWYVPIGGDRARACATEPWPDPTQPDTGPRLRLAASHGTLATPIANRAVVAADGTTA